MNVNLLPFEFIRRRLIKSISRIWIVLGALLIASMIAVLLPEYNRLQKIRAEHATMEKINEPIHDILKNKTEIESQISVLEKEKSTLEKILPDDRVLSVLSLISECVQSTEGKLQVQRFNFNTSYVTEAAEATPNPSAPKSNSSRKSPPAANKEAVAPTAQTSLLLTGVATEYSIVGKFVDGIKEKNVFSQVDLKNCSESPIQGKSGWLFVLDCRL